MKHKTIISRLGVLAIGALVLISATRTTTTSTSVTEFGTSNTYSSAVSQTITRQHVLTDTLTSATLWKKLDNSIPWADVWMVEVNRDSTVGRRVFWVQLANGGSDTVSFMADGSFQLTQPSDSSGTAANLIQHMWIKNPQTTQLVYSVFKGAE